MAAMVAKRTCLPIPSTRALSDALGHGMNNGLLDGAPPQANMTLRDVINATRESRWTIRQMRERGVFPQPTERRGGKMYWSHDVILAWLIANPPSNLGRARPYKPITVGNDPEGELRRTWKALLWSGFIPKGATHFITVNLGNPGSATSFNKAWAPKSRQIARRFINILGRILFGKTGWEDPANQARLDFFVRLETVPRSEEDGPETHLHLHAMIDLSGPFPAGCFSALAHDFKVKLKRSFGAEAFGFGVSTKIQFILDDDHRFQIADYLSKKVWHDADRIYNRETL